MVGLRPEQLQAEQPGEKQPELFDIHVLEFGLEPEQVAAGLSGIFGIDAEAARNVAQSTPVMVRRAITPEEADRFLEALKPLGAVTVLMPSREAIEQAMAMAELQLPASGATRVMRADELAAAMAEAAAPSRQLGRVALKTGLEQEPAWNSDLQEGIERVAPAGGLEWNPLEDAPSTLATLSLPRAPPPLLTRQASREEQLEAPPPLLDPSERQSVEPEAHPSHTRPAGLHATTADAAPAPTSSPAWLMQDELPTPQVPSLDFAPHTAEGVARMHGEAMLDVGGAGALDLEVDRFGQGNAHVPVHIGRTLSAAPAPPAAAMRPHAPPPPPAAALRAPAPASNAMLDALPPLDGELPPLPSLPPLVGSLPPLPSASRPVAMPAPPAAWLTGAAELPALGGAPRDLLAGSPNTRPGPNKVSPQDLRRELQANRFAMGDAPAPALPSIGTAPPLGGGAGLELDGPVRKKSRREAEPGSPAQSAARANVSTVQDRTRAPAQPGEAQPGPTAEARKGPTGKRAVKARVSREPTPIDPGLPLLVGAAVIAAGIYFDRSVLYGNARGAWFLADAAGLSGLLLAVLGAFKLTRGRFLAVLVSVAAAYAVNVYAKPLVGNDMQPEERAMRTGEVVLGEGASKREFPVTNAHLLAVDAEGLLRSYKVRELELRGVTTGDGEPDLRIFLDVQDASGEDLLTVEPDMKRLLGRELRVRAQNTMQDDESRVAISGEARPERVAGGWAVMTEVLPFDSGSGGPPTWRVSGNLELEVLGANDERTTTRGSFNVRAIWDRP